MKGILIVLAATGYTSANGLNYILIFGEALYIPEMTHTHLSIQISVDILERKYRTIPTTQANLFRSPVNMKLLLCVSNIRGQYYTLILGVQLETI